MLGGTRHALLLLLLWLLAACTGPGLEPPGDSDSADEGAADAGTRDVGDGDGTATGGDTGDGDGDSGDGDTGDGDTGDGDGDAADAGDGVGVDDDAGVDDGGPGDAFFGGIWAVEQPFHALYEATIYELVADGTVIEHETVTLGTVEKGFVTGTVARESDALRCTFGGGWHSEGPLRLIIDGVCADDVPRDITLDFPDGDAALGLVPQVSVDGDADWEHDGFGWSWRKCEAVEGCAQTF